MQKDLVQFCRQLVTMLNAGVTIVRALDILHLRMSKPKVRQRIRMLYESVQKGETLSEAMAEQGATLPPLLINMVRSGEAGKSLGGVMTRMSDHYEKEHRLSNKVRNSMIYPIVLCFLCIVVVSGLLTFVMPTLFQLFGDQDLPATTRLVVRVSDFMLEKWYVLLMALGAVYAVGYLLFKLPAVRYFFDRMKLKFPIVGKLNRTIYTARFARTMSSLYSSGITMIESVQIITEILGNAYLARQMEDVISDLKRGDTLSSAIAKTDAYDPMLFSMIYIGEESGSLDMILERTAAYFDDEADAAVTRLVSLLEPVMIIIMGFFIGFIILSVIQPIYGSYQMVAK
jgi:type IV pilus assembly protein PilC